jgi:hypothetical protein
MDSTVRSLIAIALLLAAVAAAPARAAGLTTGFFDGAFASADGARLDEAKASGASMVRIGVTWAGIAPARPAHPADPADPAYRWASTDAAVAAAGARGLQVLLSVDAAPAWAEGARRPGSVPAGAWKPSAAAAGAFVQALARRYPGVRWIQLWNEPNLSGYLAPQWSHRRPWAPVRYRAMLNAAYAGLRRAGTGARLVTAGTAPYGDPDVGGQRMMPLRFWRAVLARPVRFDVLAHHPYGIGSPHRHALNADDVAVPDVYKLVRLVRRSRNALPRGRHRFWVTEMSWDSRPPDPHGVPAATQARWLSDGLYLLWEQGVSAVFWFQVRDQPPVPSYAATLQSGVYFLDGRPKPSQRAFAFPFACDRGTVWALAPARGPVLVEDRRGHVVKRLAAGASRVVRARLRGTLHAVQGTHTSLACTA